MAPDLNSLPPSPRKLSLSISSNPPSTSSSRRASQAMYPSSLPLGSLDSTLSAPDRASHNAAMPASSSPPRTANVASAAVSPSLPLRHPRPLTAAEVHLAAEQEQEAIVNRLTRELSALRAQHSASVASTTSSTSGVLLDPTDSNPLHSLTGATHPTPGRRHRSSSTLSIRSINTPSTGVSIYNSGPTAAGAAGSVPPSGSTSQAAIERAREGGRAPSRQNSVHSQRHRSGTSSPHRYPYHNQVDQQSSPYFPPPLQPHRLSVSGQPSSRSPSISTTRYEEVAQYRAELDVVKAENETLKQRVRMLERSLREVRGLPAAGRDRSERISGEQDRGATEQQGKI